MIVHLLACAGDLPAEPHFDAPDSDGSFTPITAQGLIAGGEVDLPVQIWWPSDESDRGTVVRYDELILGSARSQGEVACPSGPLPVVVFSHGNSGVRWQSPFLTERLAAHGYVVVAPDHVFNTLTDVDDARRDELAIRRPQDVKDAFDWAMEDAHVAGCVDPAAGYAVIGHSFGGYTALAISGAEVDVEGLIELCDEGQDEFLCDVSPFVDGAWYSGGADSRAWASIPLTPVGATVFAEGLGAVEIPTLVVGGERDELTSMEVQILPIHAGLEDSRMATVLNAGHFSFSVMCDLTSQANGCGDDFLEVDEVHRLTNILALAWLGRARGFDTDAWLPPESEDLEYE